jgi:hypothetical protein
VIGKGLGCEGGTVVEEVLLRNYTDVPGAQLEPFLGREGFVGVEMSLELDLNVPGGRVDEDASTRVHVLGFGLAAATEEAALGRANEVVNRDALARKDLILSEDVHTISNDASLGSWGGSLPLLCELTSSAHRRVDETGTINQTQ